MQYAIIKASGKQYKVSEGDSIDVERLSHQPNDEITFSEVLLYVGDDGIPKVGKPLVEGIVVKGTVIGNKRGEKLRIAKFKAKSRHRRITGHRQALTMVKIAQIGSARSKVSEPSAEKKIQSKTTRTRKTAAKK